MKQNLAVALTAFLITVGILSIPSAQAGDDPVTQLGLSADAGANSECTAALRPNTHYAVQPTVNVYVRVSTASGSEAATSANVRVDANKLYDVYTTTTQTKICCKPVAAGAASTCNVFRYSSVREP